MSEPEAHYVEPVSPDGPHCATCRFRNYDSNLNEMWCGNNNLIYGIRARRVIGPYGYCERFKSEEEES